MTSRKDEVRELLKMSTGRLKQKSGRHLIVLDDLDQLHKHFAASIATEIKANNAKSRTTRLILPVGPTGQYPILAEMINEQRISLKRCWFFMMDEQCDDNGVALSSDHPLSFRRTFDELFTSQVKRSFAIPKRQLIFPDHKNVQTLKEKIEAVGGIDTTYGGNPRTHRVHRARARRSRLRSATGISQRVHSDDQRSPFSNRRQP